MLLSPKSTQTPDLTNRRALLGLAAASAATVWLPRSSWAQPRFNANPFTLGVASGAPTPDGVVLWTRLLPSGFFSSLGKDPITVRWEIAHDDQFRQIVQQGQSQAMAELAHSVHVEAAGLQSDRWYFYRFHTGVGTESYTSLVGRTRTLPTPDAAASRLRLAYASCQRWEHGYFSAYRHMAQEQLDLVMFLGDYIYEYPGAANAVRNVTGGWVQELNQYRERYAQYKSDADLQSAHAACPWVLTWDDHEVQNDYAGQTAGYTSAAEPAWSRDFRPRRAHAYQAWYEHMPVRASVFAQAARALQDDVKEGAEVRIYQSLAWGRLATLHLLDPRQYKDPIVCNRDSRLGSSNFDPRNCAAWADPARSMLGKAQEAWLDAGLSRPAGAWQVLGQSSLLGPRNFKTNTEPMLWNDGWDGYPAARERLVQSLQKGNLANPQVTPVVLGGDVHENWVGQVKASYADSKSANVGVEFCGTGITSRSGNASRSTVEGWLAQNTHFSFAETQAKGYGVCEFTPEQLTTTLRVVDDVTRKDAAVSTLASFKVQAGRAQVERA